MHTGTTSLHCYSPDSPSAPGPPHGAPAAHPLPQSKGSGSVESLLNSWRNGPSPGPLLGSQVHTASLAPACRDGWGSAAKICCSLGFYPEVQTTALVSGNMNVPSSPLPWADGSGLSLCQCFGEEPNPMPLSTIFLSPFCHFAAPGPDGGCETGPGRRHRLGGSGPAPGRCAGTGEVEKGRKGT